MHCSQVICIICHAINFLCLLNLEVTYRCQKIVDKEAIELEILDTVNKVQSDLNCVVFWLSSLCRCASAAVLFYSHIYPQTQRKTEG